MVKITETKNYDELNDLFIRNELEFSEDEPVSTDVVKAWRIAEEGTAGKLIGGIMLAKRQDKFIIDGIAIEPEYRKSNYGKMLLDEAIKEVRKLSGDSLFLVARAPDFFRTQRFVTVPKEDAPLFFECFTCPQYGDTCHPEVMKLAL